MKRLLEKYLFDLDIGNIDLLGTHNSKCLEIVDLGSFNIDTRIYGIGVLSIGDVSKRPVLKIGVRYFKKVFVVFGKYSNTLMHDGNEIVLIDLYGPEDVL